MKEKETSVVSKLALFLPLLLYGAALNPYFLPGTYDNVIFYYGAKSLAESGSFRFAGHYVVDWAPGLSVLLAVPRVLGFSSLWAAKLCIFVCVGAGLFFTFRYLTADDRPRPLATCMLFALLPTGFMMGTRLMTEWPFITLSFLFLGLLKSLDGKRRGMPLAVLAGLVLGTASLTRWIGVLLGAAVISQAFSRWKQDRASGFRCVAPEFTTAVIGAAFFCLWKLKLVWQIHTGVAEPSTYFSGYWYLEMFASTGFSALPGKVGDLFFQAASLTRYLGTGAFWVAGGWIATGCLTFGGMALHFRRRGAGPGDWYAVATLVLFSLLDHNQQVRYLLPIAPFLLGYFCVGLEAVLGAFDRLVSLRATGAALAAWAVTLAAADGYLLVYGNVSGSHAGLCVLASPNADAFYKGPWRDLYRAGRFIAGDPDSNVVAVTGQQDKYMLAFSGHDATVFLPKHRANVVVETASDPLPVATRQALELQETRRFGTVVVYRAIAMPNSTKDAPETAALDALGKDEP